MMQKSLGTRCLTTETPCHVTFAPPYIIFHVLQSRKVREQPELDWVTTAQVMA